MEFSGVWFWLLQASLTLLGLGSAAHVILHKRDNRAAASWTVLCLMVPGIGAGLYWLLGVNRIRTKAVKLLSRNAPDVQATESEVSQVGECALLDEEQQELARVADNLRGMDLVARNGVIPLVNGDQAYPRMLAAIRQAQQSVHLLTYLFDVDRAGQEFISAVIEAHRRGVAVRVLIDGIGAWYSLRRAGRKLRKAGVPCAWFLAPSLRNPHLHSNLRNHRKLLIVDGAVGFTGGMNLGDRHCTMAPASEPDVRDVQFEVQGPVVAHLEQTFLEDWSFATGEAIEWDPRAALTSQGGDLWCRGVTDGPNEDFDRLTWIIQGTIAAARRRVQIMTPYFIPSSGLITVLNTAALRGVEVELFLPARNNLPFVGWACQAVLWQVVERGVAVYYQPGPFVHSKLLVIDDHYSLVGSANLDPRSLRLNFEFNLEVYGASFASLLGEYFDAARRRSKRVSLEELDGRSMLVRLRDGLARLLSPYL